jgi:hypothetical protein
MNTISKLMICMGLMAMSGCVVAPYGYRHDGYRRGYYYHPAVVAPVVVLRP